MKLSHKLQILLLGLAYLATFIWLKSYSSDRFFSVDEYQFAQATWLVAKGQRPYLDFYEHHFPLSYCLHALVFPLKAGFIDSAHFLRFISFLYLVVASLAATGVTAVVSRSLATGLLVGIFCNTFAFGNLSSIEYRCDTFAAFILLLSLLLTEANRIWRRRIAACIAGILAAAAAAMTQKAIVLGGAIYISLCLFDRVRYKKNPSRQAHISFPGYTALGAFIALLGIIAWAWSFGILPKAYETTILDAIAHEGSYPSYPALASILPFLIDSVPSTLTLILFAIYYFRTPGQSYWLTIIIVSSTLALLMKGQFPYNFLLHSWILMICAARGAAEIVKQVTLKYPNRRYANALLLAPLVVVPTQIMVVGHALSNKHQLAILSTAQKLTMPSDRYIDSSGGLMFMQPASYFYYFAAAQTKIHAQYFEENIQADYSDSNVAFWLRDYRSENLPEKTKDWLQQNFVQLTGDLFVRGFDITAASLALQISRPGKYYAYRINDAGAWQQLNESERALLSIDRANITADGVELSFGQHNLKHSLATGKYFLTIINPEGAKLAQKEILPHTIAARYTDLKPFSHS